MADRIQLVGHLDASALFERYRAAADRVERSQLQIIWLLTSGKSLAEVAAASGLCLVIIVFGEVHNAEISYRPLRRSRF